jgi:hypothetical protein
LKPRWCWQMLNGLMRQPGNSTGPAWASARRQTTTEALNISFVMTPSATFVTEPVITIA